jgi:hypothetical protein
MKKISITLLALATATVLAPAAMAGTITGSLGVNGASDTWTLPTPTSTLTFSNKTGSATVSAFSTSGSLTSVVGDDVTFVTNPLTLSAAGADGKELFSTGDGVTFTISTLDVVLDSKSFLDLSGIGWLTQAGDAPVEAYWSFSSTKSGGTTFGIDINPVPEPSDLLMLGTGLLGLAFVAFRKSKSAGLVLQA